MIDEKKLITFLKNCSNEEKKEWDKTDDETAYGAMHAYNNVADYVMEQPKVGEWTPVSEGLPDEVIDPVTNDYCTYPVTVKFEDITTVRYYQFGKGHWWHYGKNMDKYVIAWMPVFEPWKGDKDTNIPAYQIVCKHHM